MIELIFRPLNNLVYKNGLPEQDMCVAACVKAAIDQLAGQPEVSISQLNKAGNYRKTFGIALQDFTKKANVALKAKGLQIIETVHDAPNTTLLEKLLREGTNPVIVVPWLDFLKWKGESVEIPEGIPPEDQQYHTLTVVGIDDKGIRVYDPDNKYQTSDLNSVDTYTSMDFPTLYMLWSKRYHWTLWPSKLRGVTVNKEQRTLERVSK